MRIGEITDKDGVTYTKIFGENISDITNSDADKTTVNGVSLEENAAFQKSIELKKEMQVKKHSLYRKPRGKVKAHKTQQKDQGDVKTLSQFVVKQEQLRMDKQIIINQAKQYEHTVEKVACVAFSGLCLSAKDLLEFLPNQSSSSLRCYFSKIRTLPTWKDYFSSTQKPGGKGSGAGKTITYHTYEGPAITDYRVVRAENIVHQRKLVADRRAAEKTSAIKNTETSITEDIAQKTLLHDSLKTLHKHHERMQRKIKELEDEFSSLQEAEHINIKLRAEIKEIRSALSANTDRKVMGDAQAVAIVEKLQKELIAQEEKTRAAVEKLQQPVVPITVPALDDALFLYLQKCKDAGIGVSVRLSV